MNAYNQFPGWFPEIAQEAIMGTSVPMFIPSSTELATIEGRQQLITSVATGIMNLLPITKPVSGRLATTEVQRTYDREALEIIRNRKLIDDRPYDTPIQTQRLLSVAVKNKDISNITISGDIVRFTGGSEIAIMKSVAAALNESKACGVWSWTKLRLVPHVQGNDYGPYFKHSNVSFLKPQIS